MMNKKDFIDVAYEVIMPPADTFPLWRGLLAGFLGVSFAIMTTWSIAEGSSASIMFFPTSVLLFEYALKSFRSKL